MLWAEVDERPFAWVQVTAADNDPVHLGRHIALALDTIAPIARAARPSAPGLRPIARSRHLSRRWLGSSKTCRPVVLVLDDVHLLTAEQATRGVEALLSAVPPGSQIILVGRHLPVHLGRHHTNGQVFQVTVDQLAMDAAEARSVLEQAGVEPSDDELADLVARTEGWPGRPASGGAGDRRPALRALLRARIASSATTWSRRCWTPRAPRWSTSSNGPPPWSTWTPICSTSLLERSDSATDAGGDRGRAATSSWSRSTTNGIATATTTCFATCCRHGCGRAIRCWPSGWTAEPASCWSETGDVDGAVRHAVGAHEEERAANLILRATVPRLFDGRYAQVGDWLALLGGGRRSTATPPPRSRPPGTASPVARRTRSPGPVPPPSDSVGTDRWPTDHLHLPVALATVRIFLGADGVDG